MAANDRDDDVLAFFLVKPLLFKLKTAPDIRSKLFRYTPRTRPLENPCTPNRDLFDPVAPRFPLLIHLDSLDFLRRYHLTISVFYFRPLSRLNSLHLFFVTSAARFHGAMCVRVGMKWCSVTRDDWSLLDEHAGPQPCTAGADLRRFLFVGESSLFSFPTFIIL